MATNLFSFHKQLLQLYVEGNNMKLYDQNVKLFFWLEKKYDASVRWSNTNAINQNVFPGWQQHGVNDTVDVLYLLVFIKLLIIIIDWFSWIVL